MKVLAKACPHCGFVMLFSVRILCSPHAVDEIGPECPCCAGSVGPHALATELDIEEIADTLPDPAAMLRTINRFAE